ncbi:hypothetical protein DQ02_07980 [Citrobacter amalonaticus]|nr:hypothetical protein DQ02_07980 [Citrobacter amalonaticus]
MPVVRSGTPYVVGLFLKWRNKSLKLRRQTLINALLPMYKGAGAEVISPQDWQSVVLLKPGRRSVIFACLKQQL